MKKIVAALVFFFLGLLCIWGSFYVSVHVPFERNGALKAALLMLAGIAFLTVVVKKVLDYSISPDELSKKDAQIEEDAGYEANIPGIPPAER